MLSVITNVWSSVVTFVVGLFNKIESIFYTPGVDGATGSLTMIGTLALIMAGVSLLLLVFNLIRSFISCRG